MAESMSSETYRELYLPGPAGVKWKEVTLNTGASASTLQDIKVAESCGGYTYRDSGSSHSPVSNRFIHWKAYGDVLELVEDSMDMELYAARVKFHFRDTAILGGVSVHEAQGHVIVLVPTVASVHRLVFPHPTKLQHTELGYMPTDSPVPSVFFDTSVAMTLDARNSHMLSPGGSIASYYHCAATYYTADGEAQFALASSSGSILLLKMPPIGMQGIIQQFELSQSSVMQKLWTGLVPSVIRGGHEATDTVTSLVIQPVRAEAYICAVCRDHRLRVWSCKSHECVLVCNLLDYMADGSRLHGSLPAGSGHSVRSLTTTNMADARLAVHMNFTDRNQFCVLHAHMTGGQLQLAHRASVIGPQEDLVDYVLTPSTIVTLWTNAQAGSVVRTLTISEDGPGSWAEVVLQPPEAPDLSVPSHRDPRDLYLGRLFQPGRFNMQDIRRALTLQVYSQSLDMSVTGDAALGVTQLKQDVTIAVETEIRHAAVDYEMQEEDYYHLQLEQWTKFYSCCIQYHEVGGKLKGLFSDSMTGMIALIRKGGVTFLRPCDKVEALYCGSSLVDTSPLLAQYATDDEGESQRDTQLLWKCLQSISVELSEDLANTFEHEVAMNFSLDTVAGQLVDNIQLNSDMEEGVSQSGYLSKNLKLIQNLTGILKATLNYLDPITVSDDNSMDNGEEMNITPHVWLSKLFTSKLGMDVLSASLQQFAQTRFSMLRDLYLLQTVALRLGDQVGVGPALVQCICGETRPRTENLLRAYFVVQWATQTVAVSSQTNTLEVNIRQLSSLDISEHTGFSTQKAAGTLMQKIDEMGVSLMDAFIAGVGMEKARGQLARRPHEITTAIWTSALPSLVTAIVRLVWPLSDNYIFAEFLVGCCQYLPLHDYVGLLHCWCDYNAASRSFMQGLAYLHFNEPLKAAQCFNKARDGVANERFLRDRLLQTDEQQVRKLEVLYYLKVIQQFEEFGAPDVVISLARTAIGVADHDDPNVATLWSKVFKYQLELGHYTEAYNAMIENPEPSRRKDCLRQLVIVLCERGDLQSLVDFPYTDLEDEVEAILESRARSMDLTTHNYYNLLYAFHIFRNNYRKAGSVMYEQGLRLGREVGAQMGLQQQAQCYLAAVNALRLVKPEYAWIVNPATGPLRNFGSGDGYSRSPKHELNGDEKHEAAGAKHEILELHDIEKEFILVDARLRLINMESDSGLAAGSTPGPDEMVGLLVNAGMLDRAIIVSQAFDLQLHSVFENLSLRCVNLAKNSAYHMRGDNDYTAQAWYWLKANNLTLTHIAKDNSSADQAWQLLQQYIEQYEDPTARYHRCIADKLLAHGFTLPCWFVNSYKGFDFAELLRLFINYDMLEEAVCLCTEYMDAVVATFKGQDSEIFHIKGCLQPECQTVWLPYTSIDLLLHALQAHKHHPEFGTLYESLRDKLTVYTGRLQDKCEEISQPTQEMEATIHTGY